MKTALLTGGSGGIGSATKKMLEARGWNVIAPTRTLFNMSWWDGAITYARNVKKQVGAIDALIFCHGEWVSDEIHSLDDYRGIYESRVIVPAMIMKVMLRDTINDCGSVLMVSSTRGLIGGVNTAPYSAACAAQIALMQGYAREYAGVRFNCVCPGLTDTRMGERVRATGDCKPDAVPQSPESVASEIVRLIESEENGRVMRVVDGVATEAKWSW